MLKIEKWNWLICVFKLSLKTKDCPSAVLNCSFIRACRQLLKGLQSLKTPL